MKKKKKKQGLWKRRNKPAPGHGDNAFPDSNILQRSNKRFCIPVNFEPVNVMANAVHGEIVHEFPITPFDAVQAT